MVKLKRETSVNVNWTWKSPWNDTPKPGSVPLTDTVQWPSIENTGFEWWLPLRIMECFKPHISLADL